MLDHKIIEIMIEQESFVEIWHKNGLHFKGTIIEQDDNCIVLYNKDKGTQIQYKDAFSSIKIPDTISVAGLE